MSTPFGETFGWHTREETLAADELGPFQLAATSSDFTIGEDGYANVNGKVRVRVFDANTETFILDQEYGPVFDEFSTLDHDYWKMQAEEAIVAAGYDIDEVLAAARGNAA